MRAYVPGYEMRAARSLEEALGLLEREPGRWRPFAGGTDVMVLFESGKLAHPRWLSILGIAELRGIEVADGEVAIGACATYTDVRRHAVLARELPMLGMAASETGAIAIQNRGTIGGNIANASPAADTPPVLLAYGAEIELASVKGRRRVPYATFHTGYKRTVMADGELITRVFVPRPRAGERRVELYRKVGTRRAQAITKVGIAARASLPQGGAPAVVAIGVVSVGPTTALATRTARVYADALEQGRPIDASVLDAARAALAQDITPIGDIRSTAEYRLRVAQNLVAAFGERLGAGAV